MRDEISIIHMQRAKKREKRARGQVESLVKGVCCVRAVRRMYTLYCTSGGGSYHSEVKPFRLTLGGSLAMVKILLPLFGVKSSFLKLIISLHSASPNLVFKAWLGKQMD